MRIWTSGTVFSYLTNAKEGKDVSVERYLQTVRKVNHGDNGMLKEVATNDFIDFSDLLYIRQDIEVSLNN